MKCIISGSASMKWGILLLVYILSGYQLRGQDLNYSNHSIYINYGTILLSEQISVAYERLVFQDDKFKTKAKLAYGKYLSNNGDYDTGARIYQEFYSLSAVQLIGIIELNAGGAWASHRQARGFNPDPSIDYAQTFRGIQYYGSLGIRLESRHFLFRAGFGNLELLYLGMGLNF